MKIKIFNRSLFIVLLLIATGAFAQSTASSPAEVTITTAPATAAKPATAYQLNGTRVFSAFAEPYDILYSNSPQDSAYRVEMKKLQTQMKDLQKKMSDLRSDEMKKNMSAMQELNKKRMNQSFEKLQGLTYSYNDNVSGQSKGLGVSGNSSVSINGNYYRGEKGDDYIKKKIESGEVKEKVKSYSKSYNVDRNDKIQLDNKFGKITVNTWAKNEVKVEVQIKADADDDDEAQKLIDNVTITDSKDEAGVSFKTNIETDNNNNGNMGTWLSSGKTHIRKIEVNYTVYMPAKSPLVIANRFGAIKLPDLTGKVILNLSYGNLSAQQLTNPLNEISLRFGDGTIEALNSSSVDVSYGKLTMGIADNLKGKFSFSGVSVDRLKSSGDISIRYGDGFKVSTLDKSVKTLNVDATFSKVLLNVKDDYDFDVSTRMGNFYYDAAPVNVVSKTPADDDYHSFSNTKTYKGHVGKGNSDKTITIKSSYSSVKFD